MPGPRSMVWLATSRCNLACEHCYAAKYSGQQELNERQALAVLRDAACAGVRHIGFTGGEFLLRSDSLALLKEASRLGISAHLVTNGWPMTPHISEELARLNIHVCLSVDGATPETHERIRGAGSWTAVRSAAAAMKEAGLGFSTVMALCRWNWTEVGDYLSLARDLGAQHGCLIPVMPAGRATSASVLDGDAMLAVLSEADRAAQELEFHVSFWCTPFAGIVATSRYVSAGFCRTASEDVDIDPSGNVLLCDVLDGSYCNVLEKGVHGGWVELETDPLVMALTEPELREPCIGCAIARDCRGGCYARAQLTADDIHAPDPLCPRVAGALARAASGAGQETPH